MYTRDMQDNMNSAPLIEPDQLFLIPGSGPWNWSPFRSCHFSEAFLGPGS